jgi:hypothetical protein
MTKKTIKRAGRCWIDFTAYNLRRIFNLIDQNDLKQYLKYCRFYIMTAFNPFTDLFF